MTPLFATFQKRIRDDFHILAREQLEPWVFLNSGKPMRVKRHDGKQISYEGIGFEGSPQYVFWGQYIEPFIEDIVVKQITAATELAKEKDVDGIAALKEVEELLQGEVSIIFSKMVKIDQRLLGKGYPDKIKPRNTDSIRQVVNDFIYCHVKSEIEMWKTRPWYEVWYEKNKSVVWFIGVLVAVAGLYAKFK